MLMKAMGAIFSSLGRSFVLSVVLLGLYVLYRAVLPKPLKGIPYNRDAADKLFGDVPEMMGYVMRTKRIFVCALLGRILQHHLCYVYHRLTSIRPSAG